MSQSDAAQLPLIAILEDDVVIRTMLQRILAKDYRLLMTSSSDDLLGQMRQQPVNLVLLDILLPGENGIDIAKSIRAISTVPVILISGLSSAEVIAAGLNVGADDYITKPFSPLVLQARIRNALRRETGQPEQAPMVQFESCEANPLTRKITNAVGENDRPTEKEYQLFAVLVRHATQVVSRDELSRLLTGSDWSPLNRGLDVHVSHLRKKLRQLSGMQDIVSSVRGVGYRFQAQVSFPSAAERQKER